MRRIAVTLLLAAGLVLLGTACGAGKVGAPLPETVEGKLAGPPKGVAARGKAIFTNAAVGGCGACHTYKPAGSSGRVGPDLDKVAADAAKASHGTVADYIHESILSPDAYIVPGFAKPSAMPSYTGRLNEQQVADLVAFLTQGS